MITDINHKTTPFTTENTSLDQSTDLYLKNNNISVKILENTCSVTGSVENGSLKGIGKADLSIRAEITGNYILMQQMAGLTEREFKKLFESIIQRFHNEILEYASNSPKKPKIYLKVSLEDF